MARSPGARAPPATSRGRSIRTASIPRRTGRSASRAANGRRSRPALQLDLAYNALIQHVAFVSGLAADVPANCTGVQGFNLGFGTSGAFTQLANGLQIFPGGVPIYRGGVLVGGIGVSGDGVDQDDMIAFLGLHEASTLLGGAIGNAPAAARADTLAPAGSQLRYVNCPQAPFLDSSRGGRLCGQVSTSPGRWPRSAPPPPRRTEAVHRHVKRGRIPFV